MFDNYNLIIKSSICPDVKFEVRDYKTESIHTIIVRANKGAWYGISTGEQRKASFENHTIIEDQTNGDVTCGELFIPSSILSYDEFDGLMTEIMMTENGYESLVNMLKYVCSVSCAIMMMGLERQRTQRKRHEHKNKRNETIAQSTNHRKNKVFLLNDIVEYISDHYVESKGHHEIQCPCWEVRGHYRHYKNGNVVFVKAYKKGKDRLNTKPKPKEYYI